MSGLLSVFIVSVFHPFPSISMQREQKRESAWLPQAASVLLYLSDTVHF